ncbi:MAG TPA: phosphatase PAP2 family protein [Allosphingosinicella sp.]
MAKAGKVGKAVLDADAAAVEAVEPHRQSFAVRLLDPVAELGDQPQMRVLCGSVIAVGLVGGDPKLARTGLKMLAAHTLATWVKDFVKHRVDRTRPRGLHKPNKDHHPTPGRSQAKDETSFPSGHSAGAAAVAGAYAREYPEQAVPALAAGAALALAQIPRCAHYPTDVGAGLAIGLLSEAAVDAVFRFTEERLSSA